MKKIRLWTLGNLEHKIIPTESGVKRLRDILSIGKKSSDKVVDLVWGPELNVKTINVDTNEEVVDVIRTEFEKDGEKYCKFEIINDNDTDSDSLASG